MSKIRGNDQSCRGDRLWSPLFGNRVNPKFLAFHIARYVAFAARPLKKPLLNNVQKKIGDLIATSGAETVAVAFYDLASGKELLINPDISFHAASTMKVPVMMEIYRQAAAGKLALDERVPIRCVADKRNCLLPTAYYSCQTINCASVNRIGLWSDKSSMLECARRRYTNHRFSRVRA